MIAASEENLQEGSSRCARACPSITKDGKTYKSRLCCFLPVDAHLLATANPLPFSQESGAIAWVKILNRFLGF
jgi:hypothetical protein